MINVHGCDEEYRQGTVGRGFESWDGSPIVIFGVKSGCVGPGKSLELFIYGGRFKGVTNTLMSILARAN